MSTWWRDVRLGFRTLRHSPVYTSVAVLTLALAIGANTVLFGIANPLLIRALPIKDEGTLGWVLLDSSADPNVRGELSMPQFLDWRDRATSLRSLAARKSYGATMTGHGDAEHVAVNGVTANLCDLWGLHPTLGRLIAPGDDGPGAPAIAVLSHQFWLRAFQGDRTVVGRTIFLDSHATTIVGVMSPDLEFYGYSRFDLWAPIRPDSSAPRSDRSLHLVGRLAPGATYDSATLEFRRLAADDAREHPSTDGGWTPRVVSTHTAMTGPDTWVLLGLLAVVVGFVLLIACANLASLVLARIVARRYDLAVRQGLGASRLELVRPLLIESLLVSLTGGAIALGIAHAILRIINASAFDELLQRVGLDTNVLLFTAALAILTPLLFSLWPALGIGRESVSDVLRQSRTSGSRGTERRRNVLVGVQVALAVSLLVVSGLILQTVVNYQRVNPGFDLDHELTFTLAPPADRYASAAARSRFAQDLTDRLGALAGVSAVAVSSHLPVFDDDVMQTFSGTPHDGARETDRPAASWYSVSPDFFRAIDLPIVAGRPFTNDDRAGAEPVVMLNRLAADRYFDSPQSAIGRLIAYTGAGGVPQHARIVGVAADTHSSQVTTTVPQMYFPIDQRTPAALTVIVRTATPGTRAADVRVAIRQLDANVAISLPKTMQRLVRESTNDNWIVGGMFLGFAILSLLLAGGGLYGVIAYTVGLRQREIGVRLALGAAPSLVGRLILWQSLRVTTIGVCAGLVLAWLFGHAAASVLYGIGPNDPATFAGVTAVVFVVAVCAVCGPVARAMRVDPAITLRAE